MENKEIYIDGVDVSGCECYSVHREGYCGWHTPCEGDTCPYKLKWALQQLEAKEQECKRLKGVSMQKCPQCGEVYLNPMGCELYEENEELKEQFNLAEPLYRACNIKDAKIDKLKATLTEIREIAESCYDPVDKDNDGFWTILQKISEYGEG